jgi:hypothetical protein
MLIDLLALTAIGPLDVTFDIYVKLNDDVERAATAGMFHYND